MIRFEAHVREGTDQSVGVFAAASPGFFLSAAKTALFSWFGDYIWLYIYIYIHIYIYIIIYDYKWLCDYIWLYMYIYTFILMIHELLVTFQAFISNYCDGYINMYFMKVVYFEFFLAIETIIYTSIHVFTVFIYLSMHPSLYSSVHPFASQSASPSPSLSMCVYIYCIYIYTIW